LRRALLTCVALLAPLGALAGPPQADPSAAEAPTKSSALPQLDIETYTLENGLTVILNRDERVPVVAVEVRYLVGSGHEVEGKSGFAHLFEHLMFQGSEHFNQEYFAPFEPIGGRVNGTTNTDRTNYYEQVPAEYLELALWMESDRMGHFLGALDQSRLDNQRDVVKNERRQSYENKPYGMVWKYLQEALYPVGHPYQHTTIGSHEDLTAASLDDVKAFFRQYYAPANAVLTIVGAFDTEDTKAQVARYFGPIAAGKRAAAFADTPTPTATARHFTYADNVKLPRIYLAWPSPALFAEGDSALDLTSTILTDGKTSRLYQPLVYTQKVAKDVQAFQFSHQATSMYVVIATAAPGRTVDELAKALDSALREALATPPTDDEFTRALNGWRKSFFARGESVLERAQRLSNYYHFTGVADYMAADLARYTDLTPAQAHAAARKYLLPDAALRIDIVPGEKPTEAADATQAGVDQGGGPK
jgi:zinc protease